MQIVGEHLGEPARMSTDILRGARGHPRDVHERLSASLRRVAPIGTDLDGIKR